MGADSEAMEYDLFDAWFTVAAWCAYDLMRDGDEGLVLRPLAEFPLAAHRVAVAAFSSSQYRHRKLAAILAGHLPAGQGNVLADFLLAERQRDAAAGADLNLRLETQSVVEDIVFSASRWARREESRPAALQVLREVVARTLDGEYWNTASYAMCTLCRYGSGQDEGRSRDDALLDAFVVFAQGPVPVHPSNPTLEDELAVASKLAVRDPGVLQAIDTVLNRHDEAAGAPLDGDARLMVDALRTVAARYQAALR